MKLDFISDIHGCANEFLLLLGKLGYSRFHTTSPSPVSWWKSPKGRKLVLLGDYVDRGPKNYETLSILAELRLQGIATVVRGGHDQALLDRFKLWNSVDDIIKAIPGEKSHRKTTTMLEYTNISFPPAYEMIRHNSISLLESMPLGYQRSRVIGIHAAWNPTNHLNDMETNKSLLLDGGPDGWSVDETWKQSIPKGMTVISGHRNTREPKIVLNEQGGKSICIDTGCCYGGKLTAYRYPEDEFVSVPAEKVHYPIPDEWWNK